MNKPTEELFRTSALAFWRYAHDYLRTLRMLCHQHRLQCTESQVTYHLAAQSMEFALKAFLRAAGVSAVELRDEMRHSLRRIYDRAQTLGLPALPAHAVATIDAMAPHHQDFAFAHVSSDGEPHLALDELFQAIGAILEAISPSVAGDYATYYAQPTSPSIHELIVRLRSDLAATAGNGLPLD